MSAEKAVYSVLLSEVMVGQCLQLCVLMLSKKFLVSSNNDYSIQLCGSEQKSLAVSFEYNNRLSIFTIVRKFVDYLRETVNWPSLLTGGRFYATLFWLLTVTVPRLL
jgi:hypothetical protein